MKMKQGLGLLAACLLLFSGCSGSGGLSNEFLKETQKTVLALDDFETDSSIHVHLGIGEENSDMVVETAVKASLKTSPMKMHVQMAGHPADSETVESTSEMFMEKNDSSFTTYMVMDGTWVKQELKNSYYKNATGQFDAQNALNLYLLNTDWTEEGTEEVDGVSARKFTGVIPQEKVQTVADGAGALSYIGLSGLQAKMFEGVEGVAVTLWVAEDTHLPVRLTADYTSAFQRVVENMMAAYEGDETSIESLSVTEYVEDTTYRLNEGVEVEMPAEAANAISYDEYAAQGSATE